MKKFLIVLAFLFYNGVFAQNLYKTPSGKRYHLASCRMVKNVSQKVNARQIIELGSTPCKICHPPAVGAIHQSHKRSKAVGEGKSVRCKGRTKKGTRCKHWTKMANGYCFQHQKQAKK